MKLGTKIRNIGAVASLCAVIGCSSFNPFGPSKNNLGKTYSSEPVQVETTVPGGLPSLPICYYITANVIDRGIDDMTLDVRLGFAYPIDDSLKYKLNAKNDSIYSGIVLPDTTRKTSCKDIFIDTITYSGVVGDTITLESELQKANGLSQVFSNSLKVPFE